MGRTPQSTSKLILQLTVGLPMFLSMGCASGGGFSNSEKKRTEVLQKSLNQKIFPFAFESVWRAAQLALKYPISVNNMDTGTLETDWIKATDGFTPPFAAKAPSNGVRYKIALTLVKGRAEGRESVRVTMTKNIERQRDFFSEPEPLESDGLEEKVLFYRIEREILIEDGIKKALTEKKNMMSN